MGPVTSLYMRFSRLPTGLVQVEAPWLETPVTGATMEEAYWAAMRLKPNL